VIAVSAMIARALAGTLMAAAFAVAPLQCPHETDASHCWDDTPGDGLWDLAQRFRDSHDEAAARRTLEFLVERYPSSRFAPAAREQLGLLAVDAAGPVVRDR
jgi:outer membrane protein assembly factor BamD (BamD/ComL family)